MSDAKSRLADIIAKAKTESQNALATAERQRIEKLAAAADFSELQNSVLAPLLHGIARQMRDAGIEASVDVLNSNNLIATDWMIAQPLN